MILVVLFVFSGNALATNERDGSKIEGIQIFWITEDSPTTAEGTATPQTELDNKSHLYLATRTDDPLSMKFQVEVQLSGQYDYAPGEITLTIPSQIWHSRQLNGEGEGEISTGKIGGMDLSVPKAPKTTGEFNWQLINGNYVLTNTRTIGATSALMFQFGVSDLLPHNLVDMSESDFLQARVEVVTNQGNTIEMESNKINAQVDTIEEITEDEKEVKLYESYADAKNAIPASLLANLPAGSDPDDYIYARWYTYVYHQGSQPFVLDMEDSLSDAYILTAGGTKETKTPGILLGSENVTPTQATDSTFDARILDNQYHEDTQEHYDHVVYLWSAYKKSEMPPDPNGGEIFYYLDNDVVWTLTETDAAYKDPATGNVTDERKVTTVNAHAQAKYAPIPWKAPEGPFFGIGKYTESKYAIDNSITKDYPYGYGLNQLLMGHEVETHFDIETHGFGWHLTSPKTYSGSNPEDLTDADFGQLGWRQETTDYQTFFNFGTEPLTSEDYRIRSVRIEKPKGLYAYYGDSSQTSESEEIPKRYKAEALGVPDLEIYYMLNDDGVWHYACTAVWGTDGMGTMAFKNVQSGVSTTGKNVVFPDGTTDFRTAYTSNVYDGKTMENCRLGGVVWSVYPTLMIRPSEKNCAIARELFETGENPETKFKNDVVMDAYGWISPTLPEGEKVLEGAYDTSRATIAGAGYGVSLKKNIKFDPASVDEGGDNDTDNHRAILHYSAELTEKSNLSNRTEYDDAVAAGVIPAETSGIWYDLLPEGVAPMLNTVLLRPGDNITGLYTTENYQNTGRTLLTVIADLTPVVTLSPDGHGYQDKPTIAFDAVYAWENLDDLGNTLNNYIAFESTVKDLPNDTLGTIKGQQGEPDDPLGGKNTTTPAMPADIAAALKGLDKNTPEGANRFVYGKVSTSLELNTYAVTGVRKDVSSDADGIWSQGLDGQSQVTVYEGHGYTYKLRAASSDTTRTSKIVLFDTIENYHIPDPNSEATPDATKKADYLDQQAKKGMQGDWQGKGQWRGTLVSVDMSDLMRAGVAPVLYYATQADLQFADSTPGMTYEEETALFTSGNYDLTNSVWKKATPNADGLWTVPDGTAVTAIAIDARTAADGSPFVLEPGKAMTAYMHMMAPDDQSDPDTWNAKGAFAHKTDGSGSYLKEIDWEKARDKNNNMYAFNNTRMCCEQGNASGGGKSEYRMIRNDYTRVGILPSTIQVTKLWLDQNDHDKIRPTSIDVTLLRKRADAAGDFEAVTDAAGKTMQVTLDEGNEWTDIFLQVPLVDVDNTPFLYSFDEGTVDGYTMSVSRRTDDFYVLNNSHPNEQVPQKGQKTWDDQDNDANARPGSITVSLYRNGDKIDERTVMPDFDGNWTWDFGERDKYDNAGNEYVYTVEEDYIPKYVSTADGYDEITNTYHPYGDLEIGKSLINATNAAKEKEFTFTLNLMAEPKNGETEGGPLEGTYAYEVYSGTATTPSRTGTISTGGQFTLKADERIVVKDLPSESNYRIEEFATDGYTQTGVTGDKGSIEAGNTAEAAFENTYSANGGVNLVARKTINGRVMKNRQFRFKITDKTPGSATFGESVMSSYNGQPDAPAKDPTTGEITSSALLTFGELRYTAEDDGKTFVYEVAESMEDKSGYVYDTNTYTVEVKVTDNGDGSLTVAAKCPDKNNGDATLDGTLTFENTYTAKGQWTPKAWKILQGRELKADEFSFGLYTEEGTTALQTAKNDKDGVVTFAPVNFSQKDLSMTEDAASVTYRICELPGDDPTVIYTDTQYLYHLTLTDNGDGTISILESITEKGKNGEVTPVFVNRLEGGQLKISKAVDGELDDPNREFTFHVKLAGENIPNPLDFTIEEPTNLPTPAPTPAPSFPSAPTSPAPPKAPNACIMPITAPRIPSIPRAAPGEQGITPGGAARIQSNSSAGRAAP